MEEKLKEALEEASELCWGTDPRESEGYDITLSQIHRSARKIVRLLEKAQEELEKSKSPQ